MNDLIRHDFIVAFAIDEQIRWSMAEVDEQGIIFKRLRLGEEIEDTKEGIIADQVTAYVSKIVAKYPIIKRARRIGISMIGAVDVRNKSVWRVARKAWKPPERGKPLIDFSKVFCRARHGLEYHDIALQNDATCAALAEWCFRKDKKNDYPVWLYVTINEGVNCGLTHFHRSYFESAHPEMGHIRPNIRADDPFDPEKDSGCRAHTWCFEGVASGASMKQRWGANWAFNEQAWDLESFYVGQFCLNAMLAFSPDIIVLGGYVIHQNPDFLQMVRRQFVSLNAKYIMNRHTKSIASLRNYLTPATFGDEVNVIGALVLVSGLPRLASVDGGRKGN